MNGNHGIEVVVNHLDSDDTIPPGTGTRRSFTMLAGLLALLTLSCASADPALQAEVAAEADSLKPRVDEDEAVMELAREAAEQGLPGPSDYAVPEAATLDDYVSLALRKNPGISRAIRTLQVLGFRVPQVTSLDDPMVMVVPPVGNMVETAGGQVQAQVGASLKLPFPGKLETRGRVAEQIVRMGLRALEQARIQTVAAVIKAYDRYYLANVSIRINRESEVLLRQIRDVAAARYRAGEATQQDVLRSEVELYQLTNELITLQQDKATATALLNTLLNRRVDAELPPPGDLELSRVEWKLSQSLERAVASNPELAQVREQIKRDIELIKLADLDYYPDLTLGFVHTFISAVGLSPVATGQDTQSLPLGFNLPIWWGRLRAKVLEGNARALSSVEQYRELRNQIAFHLQDTLLKIDTRYRQAVLYRDVIVPRSWQAVEVSTSSYRAGQLEFTALIENWRNWLDSSLAYHRALTTLEQGFADLQQLIGMRVPRSPSDDREEGS